MDPYAGLLPLDNSDIPKYFVQPYTAPPQHHQPYPHQQYYQRHDPRYNPYAPPPVDTTIRQGRKYDMPYVQPDEQLMEDVEKAPKQKKTRRKSVEGEDIVELTANIIKTKPSVALVRKAFKKMAEMIEEEREQEGLLL